MKDLNKPNKKSQSDKIWLQKLHNLILRHAKNNRLKTQDIVKELAMSKRTFERRLMGLTGKSPKKYVNELRLQRAYQLITTQEIKTVREVSLAVGFSKPDYFSLLFKKKYGYTPYTLILIAKEKSEQKTKNDIEKK